MADVLLGQAYYLRFDPKLWRAQQPYAPLGTLYAASYLRHCGHSIAHFDAMLAHSERDWAAALDRHRPQMAVIYEDSFNYLTKMCLTRMRQAAETMIVMARERGCSVIVSGSDASDHPGIYLRAGAAAVIIGEGEATLAELVAPSTASLGARAQSIPGIAYLDAAGSVVRTSARAPIRDLDAMPRPAWDLVDVEAYRRIWRRRHGHFAMNISTTRGCPFHCNWCAKPIYGQRYVVRSPGSVVDEIAWLVRDYRPDRLAIVDDVFGLQPGWVESFATLMSERAIRLPFRCLMRADQITAERTQALVAAGCRMVWMGAESGSQRILDAMEKGVRVDQIRSAAQQLEAAGIDVGLFLQFGYPGEAWSDVEATLRMVRDINPDDIGVSVSYPLPGTSFYDRVRAELGQQQNWFDSNDLAIMYRATYPPAFYRVLHDVVHREFRSRRLAARLRTASAHPSSLRFADLRSLAAWAFNRSALPIAAHRLRRLARNPQPAASRVESLPASGAAERAAASS